MATDYRLDELARQADVASTTVRLYQTKGLLAPPRLEGRTGWYDESHVARLRLISRLQSEGHSLAGIASLLEQWERGRGLDSIVGVEAELDALLGEPQAAEYTPLELFHAFPVGSMTPELMQRAAALSLVEPIDGGNLRVPDRRFVETGAALAHLGVPLEVVLDEWEALKTQTDEIAARFVDVFESHLLPDGWKEKLDDERTQSLARTLAELQSAAKQVVASALDASVAALGRERVGELLGEDAV